MKKAFHRFRKTSFLLPKNDFWIGLGSIFNLSGSYFEYKYSKNGSEADYKAILSDWQNVGEDFKSAKWKAENKSEELLDSVF